MNFSLWKTLLAIFILSTCFVAFVESRGRHIKVEHVTRDKRNLHVKMFYTAAAGQTYAIRNANTATGDGQFSVANGGCGGANTFGANGVTEVAEGAKVSMRIVYNGGHASQANQFQMYWGCGASKNQPNQLIPKANCDDPYPALAPQGSGSGDQTLTCTLPSAAGETDCAVSVKDQRDWGGCADLKIAANAAPGNGGGGQPPANVIPPPAAGADGDNVVEASGKQDNCCKLSNASIQVKKKSETQYEFIGSASGECAGQSFSRIDLNDVTATMTLDKGGTTYRTQKDNAGNLIYVKYSGGEEPFEISLNENLLQFTNMATSLPKVCDGKISLSKANTVLGMDITLFVIVIVLLVVICFGVVVYMRKSRGQYNDKPVVEMRNPAVATKPNDNPLPSGWKAVLDEKSGDTYYFNKDTNETTWTRPQ